MIEPKIIFDTVILGLLRSICGMMRQKKIGFKIYIPLPILNADCIPDLNKKCVL
jgi:hypothetical protein